MSTTTPQPNFQTITAVLGLRLPALLMVGFLVLFSSLSQAADPWSTADVTREAVYLAVVAVDWGQTLDIANHDGYTETNPMLGPHPGRGNINKYFLAGIVLQAAAIHYLPARWRPVVQNVGIGFEVGTTMRNYKIGLSLDF